MVTKVFAALRSLVYASGFVALWWWVVASVRPLDARIAPSIPAWLQVPGLVLIVLGAALALYCIMAFALVGRGTPAPFDAPREFVAVGPYRYTRNPMYIGAMAVIFGAGLMLRSPAALGVAVLFFALAHLFVLVYEEPALEQRFGAGYLDYKHSVSRWLPKRPGRHRGAG